MPSPIGHALGGLAAAFLADSFGRPGRMTLPVLAASAAMAVAPDLDLLVTSHRTYTHSLGAVAAVALISAVVLTGRRVPRRRATAALTAATASHILLDWLSRDTRAPVGLTALWPFSSTFYQSPWTIFGEISRRYWLPGEFIAANLRAAAWETFVLAPVVLVLWAVWSHRTLMRPATDDS